VKHSGERRLWEGCLSVPGYQAEINRSRQVTVKALNREGREIRLKAVDTLLAQALGMDRPHQRHPHRSPQQRRRAHARAAVDRRQHRGRGRGG
jgi:hypothetical protein